MATTHGDTEPAAPNTRPADRHGEGDVISGRSHKPTKEEEEREVNTPGDGTLPDPQPGGETDPGTG